MEIKLISQTAKSTKTPSKLVRDSKAADMQTHSKAIILKQGSSVSHTYAVPVSQPLSSFGSSSQLAAML